MRYVGSKTEIPVNPDAVAVFVLAANTAQAMDYPTGADFGRVTFVTSAGAAHSGVFNGGSTGAVWGTSQTATAASSAAQRLVAPNESVWFTRPRSSTSFSVIAVTSGYCHVEFWSRAGTTGQ